MRHSLLLLALLPLVPLSLAACQDPAPAPVAESCNEAQLVAKIEAFNVSAARLTGRAAASGSMLAAAEFGAFASRIREKSDAIKARASGYTDDWAYMQQLCKDYGELQGIVDEAAARGAKTDTDTPAADATPKAGGAG